MNNHEYPPGSDNKSAPWNSREETELCEQCKGKGRVKKYYCIDCENEQYANGNECEECGSDDVEYFETVNCYECGGYGTIIV